MDELLPDWDELVRRSWETVKFHCITCDVNPDSLTDDEKDAIQTGISSALHVALEAFRKANNGNA